MANTSDTIIIETFPFMGALFLVFLVLKLTGTITWSWWWVTAPLWVGPLFTAIFVLAFIVLAAFVLFFAAMGKK